MRNLSKGWIRIRFNLGGKDYLIGGGVLYQETHIVWSPLFIMLVTLTIILEICCFIRHRKMVIFSLPSSCAALPFPRASVPYQLVYSSEAPSVQEDKMTPRFFPFISFQNNGLVLNHTPKVTNKL